MNMKFERGKDPKEAMGIGISQRWKESVIILQALYKFEIPSEELVKEMSAKLEKIMGLPVEGVLYWDEESQEHKMTFKLITGDKKDEV